MLFRSDPNDYTRRFVSSNEQFYSCPRILLSNKEYLQDCIVNFLKNNTSVLSPETIYTNLVLSKQISYTELDLVYNLVLPYDTKIIGSTYFLQTYNLAIINPYARKAIQYI